MPEDDIIKKAIAVKSAQLKSNSLDPCENEQVSEPLYTHYHQTLNENHPVTVEKSNISQEDIAVGLSLYMIGRHCPGKTMKIGQFLLGLANEESLPTFILATVNTLQSGQLSLFHKTLVAKIYQVLDDFFGFHLGKILLASSSPDQLTALQSQDLPFLTSTDQLVQNCLSEASCKVVLDQIQGNTNR